MRILFYPLLIINLLWMSCGDSASSDNGSAPDSIPSDTIVKTDTGRLYLELKRCDSLLFEVGFNTIDTAQVAQLIADDFEFYHDEHGVTESKTDFVNGIASFHELPFKTWRKLQPGTLEVFPLYRDNKAEMYGAIQNGIHEFYQQEAGKDASKTSTARFSHLWILENGSWKLKRVFSYDHH